MPEEKSLHCVLGIESNPIRKILPHDRVILQESATEEDIMKAIQLRVQICDVSNVYGYHSQQTTSNITLPVQRSRRQKKKCAMTLSQDDDNEVTMTNV